MVGSEKKVDPAVIISAQKMADAIEAYVDLWFGAERYSEEARRITTRMAAKKHLIERLIDNSDTCG
jgi:hypothetical protein